MRQKYRFYFILLSILTLCGSISGQSVVINELQNKNYRTIADEDGDYEDWVEIINLSSDSINLSGYGLTDDEAQPFQWIFPDLTILSGEIIIVWLSGKNRTDVDSELHANFSLSDSEPLILADPNQEESDAVPPVYLLRDISYGRTTSLEMAYFGTPTPGGPNLSESFSGICDPPVLSHSSGFYEESFTLSISTSPGNSVIYTTDGSDPATENIDGASIFAYKNSYAFSPSESPGPFLPETLNTYSYSEPIAVEDRSGEPDRISQKSSTNDFNPAYFPESPSFKGTVVRARSTAPDLLPSEIVSRIFFVTPEGWNRYNLPVASLILSELHLFDYQIGIHTAGRTFDQWREANPDEFPPPIGKANYGRRGELWERPAWIDFFDMTGQMIPISTELGVRIHGASSRKFPRKSFRLYAQNSYNTNELNYPFFGNDSNTTFERLILRNSGGDQLFGNMRDAVVHRMADPMRAITSASQPHYVFINGEFYGLNILREHFDDNYFKIHFGIEEEDLDLIKGYNDIDSGDDERFLEVYYHCLLEDFTDEMNLNQFDEWVETSSFIDVFIVQMIASNSDMLPKNTIWWRNKSPDSPDDRFHAVLIDLDRSWGHPPAQAMSSPDYDMVFHFLEDTLEAPTPYLVCFNSAMQNQDFRNRFITRTADVLNTYFVPERTISLIEEMRDLYLPQYGEHIERWSGDDNPQTIDEWLEEIEMMVAFAEERPDFHRQHIDDFFETGGLYDLVLDVSDTDHGHVDLNTISVQEDTEGIYAQVYPWEGIYFKDVAVTLTAVPNEGFIFSHWEGALTDEETTVSSTFASDSVYVKAVFAPDTTVGTIDHSDHQIISVFPNPSDSEFQIGKSEKQIQGYTIYDLSGRVIGEKSTPIADQERFTISGSDGIYFLEIRYSDGTRGRAKVVKQ